jgi:glycosyltransferase involved in cell wall biosynthesis
MTGTDKILAICICTDDAPAARPRLQLCLASALGQDPGAGMRLVVILVDNSETGTAAGCDPAIRYVHEPIRGIPFARNAGLEEAINLRADLIGFIDADELAPLGWVALLRAELEASGADVVQGDVRRFSDDASLHAFCSAPVAPVTRRRSAATGATNNTLMRAWIVDASGLRFDTAMRFTGGSDGEFFMRASDAGAVILRLRGATVGEVWPPERASHPATLARSRRVGANCRYRYVKNRSVAVAFARITLRCGGRVLSAMRKVAVAAPAALITGNEPRRHLQAAMVDLSFVQGCLSGTPAGGIDPYQPTDASV